MSRTFVIAIDGNKDAEAFLDAVQKTMEVGYPENARDEFPPFNVAKVLFIYPTDDEPDRKKQRKRG